MNKSKCAKDKPKNESVKEFTINTALSALFIVLLFILTIPATTSQVNTIQKNLTVKIYTPLDFSNIYIGISDGGYRLIAEKGTVYNFRVFVKNGMTNMSFHNIRLEKNKAPFKIVKLYPENVDQLKPLEITIFYVDVEIPENTSKKNYPISFDLASEEFPGGVFQFESEIRVVDRIKTEYYPIYSAIIIAFIILVIYRKMKFNKTNKKFLRHRRIK
jgi:uncharacterized membrane protein